MPLSNMRWVVLCAALAAGMAADQPDPLLLARFLEKVKQDLIQLPNYTCLETIQRSERSPRSRVFNPLDTVRLEVSRVAGKELFSWPGARRFEEGDIASFLARGTSSTGLFGLAAHELFVTGAGEFKYRGEERLNGRPAICYDFHLPQLHGYMIRVPTAWAQVAVKGWFCFDPVSLDLMRIQSYGTDMPPQLDIQEVASNISYARVAVGRAGALLPREADVVLAERSGAASRNQIGFSQCHEYQTESTISFDPPAASGSDAPEVREVRLPPGLLVPLVLETAIDSRTSAIGDPVQGKVRKDVRRNGELVLPAGAAITGRIRRLERAPLHTYFTIGVELLEVQWANAHADFYGELVESDPRKDVTAGFAVRGSVTCTVAGKQFHLDPGLGLLWRVLERPGRSRNPF